MGPVVMLAAVTLLPNCWTVSSIAENLGGEEDDKCHLMILSHGTAHLQELARICSSLQDQLVTAEVRHSAIVGSSLWLHLIE